MDALALLRAERQRLKEQKSQNQRLEDKQREQKAGKFDFPLFVQVPALQLFPLENIHASLDGNVVVYREFVTRREEQYIMESLYSPTSEDWVSVRNRRLKCFGGDPVPGADRYALPEWLQRLARYVEKAGVIDYMIDHVLVNEYSAGQGILPHTDGPSYHPCVACLSVGDASGVMTFTSKLSSEDIGKKEKETLLAVRLEPRSLVVFKDAAYSDALHGIDDVQGTAPRVSLTMRKILI